VILPGTYNLRAACLVMSTRISSTNFLANAMPCGFLLRDQARYLTAQHSRNQTIWTRINADERRWFFFSLDFRTLTDFGKNYMQSILTILRMDA
jgi:hypothetical protein